MARPRPGGEDDLIQSTFAPLASGFPGALGLKDDCALIAPPDGEDLVVTTDAVAEGVHFFSDDAAADIAWKALAVNVSDLAAKGARPLAYLMALSFPAEPEASWLAGFAGGLRAAQDAFSIALAGGDTDRRPGPLTVTITAIGSVPRGCMVRRDGARGGDLVFVSGTLGDSALGLGIRRDAAQGRAWGLDDTSAEALRARYLRPEPRIGLVVPLRDHASAAMDVSDGLVKDAKRLARASDVAITLDAKLVPLSAAARAAVSCRPDLLETVVTGGDDYEVLATVPPDQADLFRAGARERGVDVTVIGRVTQGTGLTVLALDGRPWAVTRDGWDHFPA